MATAAGDSTSYGGGAGGKFRKRPFRRAQTTPYDRPPTALRNSCRSNGGWLSRILDPASRVVTASAQKLFSSVFRKRLLPPPSQHSPVEPADNHVGEEDPSGILDRDISEENTRINGSDGVAELEHILKQKTFTRSEIDRLTALLHSRTVEKMRVSGHKKLEVTPSDLLAGNSRQEGLDVTACENEANPSGIPATDLTPALRSKVNDDDIASPAELAKAYMGSRSTRVSPSMIGPRSQAAVREETPGFTTFQLHRPSVSTAQKLSGTAGTSQKGVIVPRSQGRSAIYSMARTPYSRVLPIATKGLGASNDAFDERSFLSSQKVHKRRFSVLENDIGSVGPIRRIRQKPNLLYPKTVGLPSSRTPLTHTTSEVGEASLYSSSKSKEDRGDRIPGSSSHVSSKAIEMGQRILQQLENLTPPKERSSEKKSRVSGGISMMELTPGETHKSFETVDSLKYLQNDQVSGKIVDSLYIMQDSTPKKQDKAYEGSSKVFGNSLNKVYPENKARTTDNDVTGVATTAPVVLKSVAGVPPKSHAFQMSAYEDYLELDDDAHSNGVAPALINEGTRNLEASSIHSNGNMLPLNPPSREATKVDMPPAFPNLRSSSNSVLKNDTAPSSSSAEKGVGYSFSIDSVSKKRIGSFAPSLEPVTTSVSNKVDIPASNISFGLSEMVSPISSFSSSSMESVISKVVKPQSAGSVFAFVAGSTDDALKSPGSNNKSTAAVDSFKSSIPSSLPGSTTSIFSSGMSVNTSTGCISSLGLSPITSSVPSSVLFSSESSSSSTFAQSTFTALTAIATNTNVSVIVSGGSNSVTSSVALPSFQSGLTSKGSLMASDSAAVATFGTCAADKSKETALGNSTSSSFSGAASAATPISKIVGFQFGSSTTSSTNGQLQISDNVSSRSIFCDQHLPSATAASSTVRSIPSQPAASALPASSGPSGLAMNSGVEQFAPLSSVSAPFSSSSAFGSGSSGSFSVAASGSTNNSASTNIFGGSWQPSTSPVFGSGFNNSSSGLSFGASSLSTPSISASSAFRFGATSISAPANGTSAVGPSGASSSSAAAGSSSASSGPSFGASSTSPLTSASSGFAFGMTSISASANGSSAGVPYGAASTFATASVFAFGGSSSAPSSTTSPTFSFKASSASASATPAPIFPFGSASSAPASSSTAFQPSQPAFGSGNSVFGFGSAPSPSPLGNSDQMNMEDGMAEDSMQSPTPSTQGLVFGQSPTNNFAFSMAPAPAPASSGANPFQFGSQQNQTTAPQNPFQASGSFDGGSFSLGTGGNDKSNRRIVKVKNRYRKK